jgi:sialate O-acetylesterase
MQPSSIDPSSSMNACLSCNQLRIALIGFGLCVISVIPVAAQSSLLHPLFSDHAVLQRDQPLRVWGTAPAGETVTLELGANRVATSVDEDGSWSVRLPRLTAGGPYVLSVSTSGGGRQRINDVLVGDVFLCSGQSNMEWPVRAAMNVHNEIAAANHPNIRHLTVQRAASPTPLSTFADPVAWQVASPQTVGDWSAVCFYFARELQRHTDVPIGLINSSWGGTDIRSWMDAAALREIGGYEDDLRLLDLHRDDERAAQLAFGELWTSWWHDHTVSEAGAEPWQPSSGQDWPAAPPELGDWKTWGVSELDGFLGMVWHRATFELTAEQARQGARLSLGAIDEVDQTWLNGATVGHTFGWGTPRTYDLPDGMLREGTNVLVVNVHNSWGQGGMVGDPSARRVELASGEHIALDSWQYRRVDPQVGAPPRAPWVSVGGRTTLRNAMIAPLGSYGITGAVWYQGESNTGASSQYEELLSGFVSQLRRQFGSRLPVLVVQLANFGAPHTSPTESGWAELREAQRRVAESDTLVGLAVTVDIGEPVDIHPPNKQEVGRRLARAARSVIYGADHAPSGPRAVSARRARQGVLVTLEDVEGELVAYSHPSPIGFELCGEEEGSCRFASAEIEGSYIRLRLDGDHNVSRVRFLWADSPVTNLYDASGLPVGPFELPIGE